ncbi:hypothetical protein JK320_25440 [Klebsiella pneumoniae]|uniref:hypothetical protein n=1 Tax=Klebsiella pneumoniae TaxID=573 RepID=UPI00191E540B|nr:hypothetical protein [Klebsiella pneumoniae]MBL0830564.1 hypothetical protein [Klebsiella pneumoniae]
MAARARTPVARRRLKQRATRRPALRYRQTRATIVLLIFIVFFGWLWMVNGDFTASFVMTLAHQPAEVGWAVHVFISLIELAPAVLAPYLELLPRRAIVLLWALSLPFALADVLSSALGVAPYFLWTGATGFYAHAQNTAIAEFVSVAPERMIVLLFVALAAVVRSKV